MSTYTEQLAAAVAEMGVTGASFAYWDGNEMHTAVAGLRNSVTGDPVTVDTVMHIGSITKVLNAALLMQLVDEGKISLEDPVTEYLPELRIRDRKALGRISCAMLINHTSGLDGGWLPEFGPDRERIVDSIERCGDLGQLFNPGEATSYNNIATVIAGYLVQRLRGESWYTLIKTRVYDPLDMRHALVDPLQVPRFRCSVGDLTDPLTGNVVQTTRPFLAPSFAPAGSTQMMTATDLVTFARAMLNGGVGPNGARILSRDSASRMMARTAAFVAPAHDMGLGWMILPGGVLTHSGSGPGVYSQLFAHRASGRAFALLTNCDMGHKINPLIVDPMLESWTGAKTESLERRGDAIDPAPFEGVYEDNLQRAEVLVSGGGLALNLRVKMDLYDNFTNATGREKWWLFTLYPLGDDRFEAEGSHPGVPSMELRFVQPGELGRMRYLAYGHCLLIRTR